jgi:hypothetical protein
MARQSPIQRTRAEEGLTIKLRVNLSELESNILSTIRRRRLKPVSLATHDLLQINTRTVYKLHYFAYAVTSCSYVRLLKVIKQVS